jgi:Carboxypeptidase regulatory-like domain
MTTLVSLLIAIAFQGPTGQISGRVTDPSAAVLPGVEVTVTQTETGLVRSAVTNEVGVYTFPSLPVGPYKLEASLPGFRSFVQTGIVLQVNANLVMDASLQVGQVGQTVEVQANSELQVETRSMSVGTMMDRERILELPLSGRKVTDLVTLTGAAVQTGTSVPWGMNTGVNISAAGGRGFSVGYSLDGSMHTNRFDTTNMPLPFPDALQEFRVNTGTQESGTAKSTGASVSSVTKAGTNSIHGDVFEYVRNAVFNAQQESAPAKDQLKRNQFGGTLGGPILKNKVFFFLGYQGTEERNSALAPTLSIVPTAAILSGDWTSFNKCFSPRWSDPDLSKGTIDPARYSNAAKQIAARLPQAQDSCGDFRWGLPVHNSEKQIIQRFDYQRSAKQSFFGRYFTVMQDSPVPYDKANLLTAGNSGVNDRARMLTLGHTWVLNSTTVNTAHFAYNRITVVKPGAQFFSPQDVGINAYTSAPNNFNLIASGFFSFGNSTGGAGRHLWQEQFQIGDDLSLTRGKHQITFGGTWARDSWINVSHARSVGIVSVDGTAAGSTGNVLGDFMLGKLGSIRQAMPETFSQYQQYASFYAQDTWRATSRVTLNYGIRWEPFIPPAWFTDPRNPLGGFQTYRFSVDAFKAGTRSIVFPTAPAGFLYPKQPGGSGLADIGDAAGIPSDWGKVGPRLGIAWDPTGKGKTSIRAGYSLAYDVPNLQLVLNAAGVSPWAGDTTYRGGTLDNPWQGLTGGNPFPFDWKTTPRFVDSSTFLPFSDKLQSTYAESWNLTLQQQVARRWLVSGGYIGSLTPHIWATAAANGATYLTNQAYPTLFTGSDTCVLEGVSYTPCNQTANINQRRELRLWAAMNKPSLLPDARLFSNVDQIVSNSTSKYDGMLLSVRGELPGITVNSNYTWSRCISDRTNDVVPNTSGTFQRGRDRGNCGSDRRQIFNLTAVASSPKFQNRWLRPVASDWRLSTIYRVSSGSYLTVTSGVDRTLTGLAGQTADQVAANTYTAAPKALGSVILNKSAFNNPALGSFGNMDPLSVLGLGTWSLDASVSRTFKVKESGKFEFRAEAFNVPNAVRPLNPSTSLLSPTFGKITAVDQPRVMQFALKYDF